MVIQVAGAEAAVASAVIDALAKAEKEGWLDRARSWLQKRHKVLVLGSSGAGKSQLIKSMTESVPEAISYLNRTQFIEKHKIKISNELFEFVEAPGDILKPEMRDKAIREALRENCTLVINLVSFGYHEYALSDFDHVFTKQMAVREKYLKQHQEIELDLLDQWLSQLFYRSSECKLITVISKADVWWDDRSTVISHYRDGLYSTTVSRFTLQHAIVPYSSQIQKVYGRGMTARSFDETDKTRMKSELLRNILISVGSI